MKKYLLYPLAIFISIGSMALSCDEVDDLLDVTSDTKFEETFTIDTRNVDSSEPIFGEAIINPTDYSGYNSVKERIKDMTIEKITYKVIEKEGNGSNANMTIEFLYVIFEAEELNAKVIETIELQAVTTDTETELNIANEDIEKIRQALLDGNTLAFRGLGTLKEGPVHVDATFSIYTKITASSK